MKKYLLYGHSGSENHGCEALVRTTISLLNANKNNVVLSSYNPEMDYTYHIDDICKIKKRGARNQTSRFNIDFLKAYMDLKINKNQMALDNLYEINALTVKKDDIALSIGGDTYCYSDVKNRVDENCVLRASGLKTVFWGCSIEPELLTNPMIAEDIKRFDLITARETISYNALRQINPNTVLVCDSAFLLNKKELPLPISFENCDLVGINSSPLVEFSETEKGMARANYCRLIEKILYETDMKILLVPHVVWKMNDDRTVLQELFDKYSDSGRVYLLEDCNCEELKGYISRCRFFVGARTHATIAAYSTGVPTLVLGYSVKSKGIARDLFGIEENYVIPVQSLVDSNTLAETFEWLMHNEQKIKNTLNEVMPEYKKRISNGIYELSKL